MIELSNISFAYSRGDYQLEIESLQIAASETVAITGLSGVGKTTLLHLIAGILTPHTGTVVANGEPLSQISDSARRRFRLKQIGMIFQEFELIEYLSVRDNIQLPYRLSGNLTLGSSVRSRAQMLAHDSGIGDKLDRNVAQLSQGERQRVAICRAVLPNPKLILADEPTGNLDPANTERVLDLIFHNVVQSGASFVCITHERHYLDRFHRVLDFADFASSKS
jgi:putative ABC transport system ATP-binding protein